MIASRRLGFERSGCSQDNPGEREGRRQTVEGPRRIFVAAPSSERSGRRDAHEPSKDHDRDEPFVAVPRARSGACKNPITSKTKSAGATRPGARKTVTATNHSSRSLDAIGRLQETDRTKLTKPNWLRGQPVLQRAGQPTPVRKSRHFRAAYVRRVQELALRVHPADALRARRSEDLRTRDRAARRARERWLRMHDDDGALIGLDLDPVPSLEDGRGGEAEHAHRVDGGEVDAAVTTRDPEARASRRRGPRGSTARRARHGARTTSRAPHFVGRTSGARAFLHRGACIRG